MDEQVHPETEGHDLIANEHHGSMRADARPPRRAGPSPARTVGDDAGGRLRGRCARHGGALPPGGAPPRRRRWLPLGHAAGQPDRLVRHRAAHSRHRAPLTAAPRGAAAARHRVPRWLDHLLHARRRRHAAGQARRSRHLPRLPGRHRRRRPGPGGGRPRARSAGWPAREPLPHSRPRPARRVGRRRRRRPAGAPHPSRRPPALRPAARGHPGGQRLGVPGPRRVDRARALPRPRARTSWPSSGPACAAATRPGRRRAGRRSTCCTPDTAARRSSTRSAGSPSAWPPPPPASASWPWSEARALRRRRPPEAGRCTPGGGPRRPG